MAEWRYRDPGDFRPEFHAAMRLGLGKAQVIARSFTYKQAWHFQREWRLFQHCLRRTEGHPAAERLEAFRRRTSVCFNGNTSRWELQLTVTETAREMFAGVFDSSEEKT